MHDWPRYVDNNIHVCSRLPQTSNCVDSSEESAQLSTPSQTNDADMHRLVELHLNSVSKQPVTSIVNVCERSSRGQGQGQGDKVTLKARSLVRCAAALRCTGQRTTERSQRRATRPYTDNRPTNHDSS